MLRFVSGFDTFDPGKVRNKFNLWSGSFDQDILLPGRDGEGFAFCILNTAFGDANYTQGFPDAQILWGFHADFKVAKVGTGATFPTSVDWFRFGSSTAGVQLSLRVIAYLADGPYAGRLQIIDAGGNLIATSPTSITMDQWYTLEAKATFNSTSCLCEIRLNGAAWFTGGYSSGGPVDQLTFRWQAFGPPSLALDNLVYYDGQAGMNTFTGRLRVTSMLPVSDVRAGWAPVPGPSEYGMVNDFVGRAGGSDDGDLTYITPGGSLIDQLFNFARVDCFGKILGLAVNACMRPAGGFFPVRFLCQPAAILYTLGTLTPTSTDYRTLQAVAEASPASGATWIAGEINGSYFGVGAPAAALVRVTAVYLEVVTSLEDLPYECGIGPYSFGS